VIKTTSYAHPGVMELLLLHMKGAEPAFARSLDTMVGKISEVCYEG
jgi:hypothetical protein